MVRYTLTNHTFRILLRLVAFSLLVGSGAILLWAFRDPAPPTLEMVEPNAVPQRAMTARASVTRPLNDFAPVWQRRLEAPLYAPLPGTSPRKDRTTLKKNKRSAPLGLRLIGTLLESGKSLAMLADADGNIHLRGVGETFNLESGIVEVDRIELQQVTLSIDDRTLTLKMQ